MNWIHIIIALLLGLLVRVCMDYSLIEGISINNIGLSEEIKNVPDAIETIKTLQNIDTDCFGSPTQEKVCSPICSDSRDSLNELIETGKLQNFVNILQSEAGKYIAVINKSCDIKNKSNETLHNIGNTLSGLIGM